MIPNTVTVWRKLAAEIDRMRDDYSILKQDYDALRDENERLRALISDALDDEVALRMMPKWCEEARAAVEPKP